MATSAAVPETPKQENPNDNDPKTFAQVLERELKRINQSREKRDVEYEADSQNLTGLAFSGGGIRSATFNLGILQAFAEKGLLRKFDYLSTVSGGGYIGSWLAALTYRLTNRIENPKFEAVERTLRPCKYEPNQRSEAPVLHWLRLYSNYLTPHTGVVSGDTWAMLGTWLRNVLLNQTILGFLFVSIFVLCQSVLLPLVQAEDKDNGIGFLKAGAAVLFFACLMMATHAVEEAPFITEMPKTNWERVRSWYQRFKVTATVMAPFVVSCVLLNCGLWQRLDFADEWIGYWALAGALFYAPPWIIVAIVAFFTKKSQSAGKNERRLVSVPALLIASPVAGAAGGCLLYLYMLLLRHLPDWTGINWVVVVFGSGVLMAIMLLVGVLHLGLVGRGSTDLVREWWARLGGYLMLITLGWLLLAGVSTFAPLGVRAVLYAIRGWSIQGSIAAVALWAIHNYLGVKAASSSLTSGNKSKDDQAAQKESASPEDGGKISAMLDALKSPQVMNAVAKTAPYIFLVGFVLLVSTVVQFATGLVFNLADTRELWNLKSTLAWPALSEDYWRVLEQASAAQLAIWGGIFVAAAFLLSLRVDVNDFSLHHFYRNRLVRCYLGASNPERKPEPFTGFDPADDLPMCDLADNYAGPYPILNAALNITGGEELGYATRRAKSFVFTPLFCGYELGSPGKGLGRFTCADGFLGSYSKTELGRSEARPGSFASEDGIWLGTAMAISGAAASPNMGYYTAPATAFFMALFDVRLGWWMGNPRDPKKWKRTGPALGLGYLLSELFAQSDQQRGYVYLSDGGHFENLAVYELIRRRCKVIVACDADADGAYEFTNLLGLIEKARTDFGARIEINYTDTKPPEHSCECATNFAVGDIHYDPNNPKDIGTLILIKAGMPKKSAKPCDDTHGRLPDDVWRYQEQNPTFPHQSTADQWFDELQFESYRTLGEYIGCQASEKIEDAIEDALSRAKKIRRRTPETTLV